jgi:hypothetical protein
VEYLLTLNALKEYHQSLLKGLQLGSASEYVVHAAIEGSLTNSLKGGSHGE